MNRLYKDAPFELSSPLADCRLVVVRGRFPCVFKSQRLFVILPPPIEDGNVK